MKKISMNEGWVCSCPEFHSNERGVAGKGKTWPNGSTLKIGFIGGSEAQRDKVKDSYAFLGQFANLKFSYPTTGPWDIRVAFVVNAGSWSYVGLDCKLVTDQTQPTMNLGFFGTGPDGHDYVVTHEAAHSIGLLHEQQNPNGALCFNESVVIAELSGPPNNWSVAQIRFNVLDKYKTADVISTPFDAASVMEYALPARWLCSGVAITGGHTLSNGDKTLLSFLYPQVAPTGPNVTITAVQAAELKQAALNAQTATNAAKTAVDANRAKIQAILGQ